MWWEPQFAKITTHTLCERNFHMKKTGMVIVWCWLVPRKKKMKI